ncbi:MAG: diphosphomevalonate decarboxylase, partial [Acidobacteria bacterium]|nr:diphosphomevalonate decarboxylase [Acidobacteriota bacterium]
MAKVTVTAPANIAFIKYWGTRELEQAVPLHPSISMTLAECCSRSTVEFRPGDDSEDEIYLAGEEGGLSIPPEAFRRRAAEHLERLRRWAGAEGSFKLATRNTFPAAAGLASSASGFAALTEAVVGALAAAGKLPAGNPPGFRELSILARKSGSGSAARSVLGGYVEWPAADGADDPEACYAFQLAPADHWALADVIALVETEAKEVSSLEGHRRAASSPHFERRLTLLPERLERTRRAIADRDFESLGEVVEEDAIELHLVAMSSRPPIFYWKPTTLEVLDQVRRMRRQGIPAYSTMDAGANVHVLCPVEAMEDVAQRLSS